MLHPYDADELITRFLWLQMDFPTLPGSHRILNVHQNVPGVLKNVNNIIADLNVNIKAQVRILGAGVSRNSHDDRHARVVGRQDW